MVLLMHSGVFIGSCDVIGMEFPKGKWVCYSRILFYSSENHKSKQLTSAVVISSGFGTRCAYSCDS